MGTGHDKEISEMSYRLACMIMNRISSEEIQKEIERTMKIIDSWKGDKVSVIRCKNCKFFKREIWDDIDGIPMIIAHNVCDRWGGYKGCVTDENGFCYIGRPKTD